MLQKKSGQIGCRALMEMADAALRTAKEYALCGKDIFAQAGFETQGYHDHDLRILR